MNTPSVERIVGYDVYTRGATACVDEIAAAIERGERGRWLACLNPHSFAVARRVPRFAAALREAHWLIPDGVGVVLASRLLRGAVRERATGFDIFDGLNRRLNERGMARIFFIGSTEETLEKIRKKMAQDYPRLQVVGTCSPPFKPEYSEEDIEQMIAAINAAKPDVLWVGMTAPKQEIWIHAVRDRLDVKFAAGIGAVFDFYVGNVKRSPRVFQRVGLEWLPRLLQEPRRLWRRTFVSAPIFLGHVLRQMLRPSSEEWDSGIR